MNKLYTSDLFLQLHRFLQRDDLVATVRASMIAQLVAMCKTLQPPPNARHRVVWAPGFDRAGNPLQTVAPVAPALAQPPAPAPYVPAAYQPVRQSAYAEYHEPVPDCPFGNWRVETPSGWRVVPNPY